MKVRSNYLFTVESGLCRLDLPAGEGKKEAIEDISINFICLRQKEKLRKKGKPGKNVLR